MDTVSLRLGAASTDSKQVDTVFVDEIADGVKTGVTAVPADEWTRVRTEVQRHYDLQKATRIDCINIITALTLALTDK